VDGGTGQPFDVIILATGFDAITGAITRIDIRGVGGVSLAESWRDGPLNYLGMAVPRFPNLFCLVGPMVPAGNVPSTCEHNGAWAAEILGAAEERGATRIEVSAAAAEQWRATVLELCSYTLAAEAGARVNSWFMGSNIPGKAVPAAVLFRTGDRLHEQVHGGGRRRLPELRVRRTRVSIRLTARARLGHPRTRTPPTVRTRAQAVTPLR
jgi:hypothetical protein